MMLASHDAVWYTLKRMHNKRITMEKRTGSGADEVVNSHDLEHAVPIHTLESELVLKFSKSEIEETLYFLEKRGYVYIEGFGLMAPRQAYSLTDKALSVLARGTLPDDEIDAFKEAALMMQPNIGGFGFDMRKVFSNIRFGIKGIARRIAAMFRR